MTLKTSAGGVMVIVGDVDRMPRYTAPETRLRLAYAALYNLLARLDSPDMYPTAEEISRTLAQLDKPTSLAELIVAVFEQLPPAEQVLVNGKLVRAWTNSLANAMARLEEKKP